MLATQSASAMSRPIWVSLTETLTSAPLAAMRSSMRRYWSRAATASASARDALAQQVERGGDAAPAQLPGRLHPLLDRLARHEPGGESPGEAVAADEVEDALPLGEPEQALSHDHDGTLSEAGTVGRRRPKTHSEASRRRQRSVEAARGGECLCNPVTGVTLRDMAGDGRWPFVSRPR